VVTRILVAWPHFLAFKLWKNSGHTMEKMWSHRRYIWLTKNF